MFANEMRCSETNRRKCAHAFKDR